MENLTPTETKISKRLRAVFLSNAFLTATVAFTVVAAFSLLVSGINLFATLFAVGMWLVRVGAKNESFAKEAKFLSGTVKAYYIVNYVSVVLLALLGIALILGAPVVMGNAEIVNETLNDLEALAPEIAEEYRDEIFTIEEWVITNIGVVLSVFLGIIMIAVGVAFVISAVISLVINLLFVRKLSNRLKECAASLEEKKEGGEDLFDLHSGFMVFGVINAILGALTLLSSGIFSAIGLAANATAYIALSYAFKVEPCEEKAEEIKTEAEL